MIKQLITAIFIIYCTTLQAQLWEQIGGNENGFFGGMYGDTVTNSLYVQALIFPPGDTLWGVLRYDGEEWVVLTDFGPFGGNGVFIRYQGDLIFGSHFTLPGESASTNIAKWDGSEWGKLGSRGGKFDWGPVNDLLVHEGTLYAAGLLTRVDSVVARGIAKWDGAQWSGMAPERFNQFMPQVFAMAIYKGQLYAGGHFKLVDKNEWNIAKWDGNDWQSVGGGLGLANPGCGFAVDVMAVYKEELYIGGCFPLIPSQVADIIVKWDGNNYKGLGAEEPTYFRRMVVYKDELYVAGWFGAQSEIGETDMAKWNGSRWCSLGSVFNGNIDALEVFNDELYVSGDFDQINGQPLRGVVKWIGGDYVAACGTPVPTNEKRRQGKGFFHIQPNPASGDVTVVINPPISHQNIRLTVHDVLGHLVFEKVKTGTGRQEINVGTWPPGLYLATLEAGGQVWTEQVVVQ